MDNIIILEPVFIEKIWGGYRLQTEFNYNLPSNNIGECFAISAHPSGDCKITNTRFSGNTLSWLWSNHRELFGNIVSDEFPLLVKILDASEDLSVQVHPDNVYALEQEGKLGKAEAWYILKSNRAKNIVMGHHAKSKNELQEYVNECNWEKLLNISSLKNGDFFYIPPGTIHAILSGTLLYEVQQSSDVTYRLYDYERLDNDNKKRELHLNKALDVIVVPYEEARRNPRAFFFRNLIENEYIRCEYFTVKRWMVDGIAIMWKKEAFLIMSVLQGQGTINDLKIEKNMNFIVLEPVKQMIIKGNMIIMVSHL